MPITSILLNLQTARDSYQLAQAEGYAGTREQWLASLVGPPGASLVGPPGAEIVQLTAAAYEALTTEEQEDITKIYAVVVPE